MSHSRGQAPALTSSKIPNCYSASMSSANTTCSNYPPFFTQLMMPLAYSQQSTSIIFWDSWCPWESEGTTKGTVWETSWTATKFCWVCGKFICEMCSTMHSEWEEFSKHEVVSIEQIHNSVKQLVPIHQRKSLYCSQHQGKMAQVSWSSSFLKLAWLQPEIQPLPPSL